MAQSRALHPAPCFNTQPPEGGCLVSAATVCAVSRFQHTAARRRLHACGFSDQSTKDVFQHTAARRRLPCVDLTLETQQCFNTQPPEGGRPAAPLKNRHGCRFQHTAARRRLLSWIARIRAGCAVSTHSRPKAAASRRS